MPVRPANPAGANLDDHAIGGAFGFRHIGQGNRSAKCVKSDGFHDRLSSPGGIQTTLERLQAK
jgi:hypothetical protein